MSASALIADVRSLLAGEPVFLAGSLVAEETYGKSDAHHDVDLFCPTSQVLISVGQKMLDNGYKLDDRFSRVWARWLRYGFKTWHTNSLRLHSPNGVETNLVYKLTDGHPTTSLGQVIESFDFGLLASGYDLEQDQYRDMRGYLFPGMDPNGPLPLMPSKRMNWRNGFISQYNGLREAGRYAKYHAYGYDMTSVRDDLVTGYWEASSYMASTFDDEKKLLGKIYEAIAVKIEDDAIDELSEAYATLDFKDSLDVIMEALE
jgi:hypothetical protein